MAFHTYILISLVAFAINLPFGYIREGHPKFSAKWLFWIHASIPVLVYLRITLETSKFFIPATIVLAVLGQIIGSRYRRKKMTKTEADKINQIPDTRLPVDSSDQVDESDVIIALLNMGGPKTNSEVRDFLKRIFLDPLIIRFPLSFLLQSFFAWLLVTVRGKEAEERYKLIGGGSPILHSTAKQVHALSQELKGRGRNVKVIFSFNYSWPLPFDTIEKAKREKKRYLLPLSLYSHYSSATTGSNMHYLKKEAKKHYPSLVFLKPPEYYLHDGYIEAFVDRIHEQVGPGENLDDFYLLFSAHGLPLYFLTEGDPYPYQVNQTVAKVVSQLKRPDQWAVSYQSDVGPLQWIKPSTEAMLHKLAEQKIKKLLVIPVSFVTDHIETLCEIDIEYRKMAEGLGIDDFRMSKAIESHPGFIRALADSVEPYLKQSKISKKKFEKVLS